MTNQTNPAFDGLVPLSASQLVTFTTCRRAWAFDKLEGVERPETEATNEGKAIHQEVEDYFRHGTAPTRKPAQALLQHLPGRHPALKPEFTFELVWPGEPAYLRGAIDLLDPRVDFIYDHKTTTNIDRYAKTEDDLRLDAQTVMYGLAYRALIRRVDDVNLQWTYVQREDPKTRPPKTRPVVLTQTKALLEEGLHHWAPVVTELVQIHRAKPNIDDVPASPGEACFKYGGCHYRYQCSSYAGRKPPVEKETPVSVDFSLLASLGASLATTMPVKPAATPEPEPESRPLPGAATVHTPPPMPLLDSVMVALDIAPAVVPPDAQPNVSPSDPPPPTPEPVKRGRGRPKKDPVVTINSVPMEPVLPPPPSGPVLVTPREAEDLLETQGIVTTKSPKVDAEHLETFIEGVIAEVVDETPLAEKLQAATLAMELLKYRRG